MPGTLLTRWRSRGTPSPAPPRTTSMAGTSPLPWPRSGPGRPSPRPVRAIRSGRARITGHNQHASFLGEGNARSGVVAGAAALWRTTAIGFLLIELPFLHIGLSVQHAFGEPGSPVGLAVST